MKVTMKLLILSMLALTACPPLEEPDPEPTPDPAPTTPQEPACECRENGRCTVCQTPTSPTALLRILGVPLSAALLAGCMIGAEPTPDEPKDCAAACVDMPDWCLQKCQQTPEATGEFQPEPLPW
jgi:hypothetical protein